MAPFDTTNAGVSALGDSGGGVPAPIQSIPMGAAPAAPELQGPAPEAASFSNDGGVDQLGDLNLRPPVGSMRTGVSASPAEQLTASRIGSQASQLMASAPDPNAPMAWAKAWLGAATGVIGSLGDSANVKAAPGGGFLDGISQTLANRNERLAKQKEQAAQQQHQKFEEQRETNKDQQEQEAFAAQRTLQYVQNQKALRSMSKEDQDAMREQASPWIKAHEEAGQKLVQDGLSSEELQKMAKDHATPQDPNGIGWLHNQDIQQTGWRDEKEANGDIKMKYGPNGEVQGPDRRQTYGVFTWGDDMKVTPEIAKQLKSIGHETFQEGDTIPAKVARGYELQIQQQQTGEMAAKKMLLESGKTDKEIADLSKQKDMTEAGKTLTPWMVDAKWDTGVALQNMQEAIAEKDPQTGQPTPHAQAVQQQYDQIMGAMGPELIKDTIAATEKNQLETIKANAAKAKSGELPLEGDTTLSGPAYAASLPPGRKELVTAIGTGKAGPIQMARMLSGKDGQQLSAEMFRAYPDFDGSRIKEYQDMLKEYNPTGKIGKQIIAMNTSLPHLDRLYSTIYQHPTATLPGVGKAEAMLGDKAAATVQTAKTQAAQELANLYAGGAVTDQEHKEFAKELDVASPAELRNNIAEIVRLLHSRIDSIDEGWSKAAPSEAYKPPYQSVDSKGQAAIDHILALDTNTPGTPGSEAATRQGKPAAKTTQTTAPKTTTGAKAAPQAFKVGDTFMQNGHQYTVASVDAHGRVTGAN